MLIDQLLDFGLVQIRDVSEGGVRFFKKKMVRFPEGGAAELQLGSKFSQNFICGLWTRVPSADYLFSSELICN